MPKILERLVGQIMRRGVGRKRAFAIAVSALQKSGNLKKGTTKATAKGRRRGRMTPAARLKSRRAKAKRRRR